MLRVRIGGKFWSDDVLGEMVGGVMFRASIGVKF